ncbi:hypothetical protein QFC19_005752 [Naganishia cerealis]|uniref:Uncharacterized protein n=1 Tax=Naganishia cerealis TaxID=610337 RepID=A0ACC2VLA5_9TREE|nr:hypothetical protein QFC19_005752 [Naganishia cerealis]
MSYGTPYGRGHEIQSQHSAPNQNHTSRPHHALGGHPLYPPVNPYPNGARPYHESSPSSWERQSQIQSPSERFSQAAPMQWRTPGNPSSPSKRRTIGPGIAVPGQGSLPGTPYIPIVENDSVRTNGSGVFPPRLGGPRKRALSEGEVQLNRQGTLLTPHATEKRASAELGIMLGSGRLKIQKGKLLPQGELPIEEKLAKLDQVKLEAKKGRKARVEVDVILESDVMVEGGQLRGRLEVRIRKSRKGESLWIGAGKIRVCGYEEHPTEVRTEQGLGWSLSGEKGKVRVIAELPRPDWVAGQNVWIKIFADNQSQKKLVHLDPYPEHSTPRTSRLIQAAHTEAGPRSQSSGSHALFCGPHQEKDMRGHDRGKSGNRARLCGFARMVDGCSARRKKQMAREPYVAVHDIQSHLLSIRRSRLIEITYIIRLTLNNTITLDVPLNIINFLSIDPPPSVNVTIPAARMTATDSHRIEMEVDSSVRTNEDFGGKQGRYSGNSEDNRIEVLISDRGSSRASKTKSQIFYPNDRQRPESIYQEDDQQTRRRSPLAMPEPPPPFNKPRPSSMSSIPSRSITPQLRPPLSKRDTSASYYSAVASLAEEEDLKVVETRRRHGRQMSLAALTGKRGDQAGLSSSLAEDQEEDRDEPGDTAASTPSAGTYAPSVTLDTTMGESRSQELEEAERDLEFVEASVEGHESVYDRDSASRYLESELAGESSYHSRFRESQSDESHGSCMDCHERLSHQSGSIHTCESASMMEEQTQGEEEAAGVENSTTALSAQALSESDVESPPSRPRMTSLSAAREQHMLATRSVYGSVAGSAISVARGTETDIGQVVQAIRRDLSIRQPQLGASDAMNLRLGQARSPEPSLTDNGQSRIRVRSNSLAPPLVLPAQSPSRRPSAPATWQRKNSYITSLVNPGSRANSVAIDMISEQDDQPCDDNHSDPEQKEFTTDSPSVRNTNSTEADQMIAGTCITKSARTGTPVQGISVSPGLAPSIGDDSASSHQDSRATTPTGEREDMDDERDLYVMEDVQEPLSPTEHALEQLMIEADETMASLGLDTLSRKNLAAKYSFTSSRESDFGNRLREREGLLRSPAGPRHRNSVASTAPDSPLSQYSESITHGQDLCRSPEFQQRTPSKEQTTPTRRSHTAILGAARNRISNRTSGTSHTTDYLTHSPGSSINSQHMIMTPGRHHVRDFDGQYHLEDIPEVRSMASDPSLKKREVDRNSITSISTTATTPEKILLERKSSAHVFPYSRQMSGYTTEQLRPMNGMSVSIDNVYRAS